MSRPRNLRLATVNRALAARGIALELVQGEGYFYVVGEGVEELRSTSIYCYRLNDQPLDRWIEDCAGFADEIAAVRAARTWGNGQ